MSSISVATERRSGARFPLRLVSVAAIASTLALGYLTFHVQRAYRAHLAAMQLQTEFLVSSAELKPYVASIGVLVRLAAADPESHWMSALEEAKQRGHELMTRVFRTGAQLGLVDAARALESTHERLDQVQARALALARVPEEWAAAQRLLDSERYRTSEWLFKSATANLIDQIAGRREAHASSTEANLRQLLRLAAGLLLVLAGAWATVLAHTLRQQRARELAERRLREALAAQDRLVAERTRELTAASERLASEAEARERAARAAHERGRALAAEMGRLHAVLENMDQGLTFFDSRARLALCNRPFLEMNQLALDQVAERKDVDALRAACGSPDPVLPEAMLVRLGESDAGLPTGESATELRRDARGRHYELRSRALPGGGFVTVYTDLSERIEGEERVRAVLENVPCGILMVAPDGRIAMVNSRVEALFGYRRRELFGEPIEVLVPKARRAVHLKARRTMAGAPEQMVRAIGEAREVSACRRDGSEFDAEIGLGLIETAEGPMVLCAITDVTERHKLQTQLLHSQKLESIGQLAAGIAHEINTPTQYVGDNVRFFADAFADILTMHTAYERLRAAAEGKVDAGVLAAVDEARENADWGYLAAEIPSALEQAEEGVHRVGAIVRAMKEFSHPGGETKESIDLNHVIENTVTVARNEWKYVADLELDLDPRLPPVPCLPGDIGQVVLNLVVNAAHAIGARNRDGSDGKGTIRVSSAFEGAFATIRVADDGGGVPAAVRARIFDPFFTTKEVGKGTGQGLAIARNVVVVKHGGTIDFETVDGVGTTFVVKLPLDVPEGAVREDAA